MKIPVMRIAGMLLCILVLSLALTALCGVQVPVKKDNTVQVVAASFPMYTATLQVAEGSGGVTVHNLTKPTAGCLHDYQLSPAERLLLDEADVVILSGAEPFMEPLYTELSAVLVNTTDPLFAGIEESYEELHHDHAHTHMWLDPDAYETQVEEIMKALCEADAANAALYRQNAAAYIEKTQTAVAEFQQAVAALSVKKALLFHESMAELAEVAELQVVGLLPIGEDSGFSAAEVAKAAEAVRGLEVLFLYDEQYPQQMTQLLSYTSRGAAVSLCSAVKAVHGVDDADIWLWSMRENAKRIKAAMA